MKNIRCYSCMLWCLWCLLPLSLFSQTSSGVVLSVVKEEFRTNLYGFTYPAEWDIVYRDQWYSSVGATEWEGCELLHFFTYKLTEEEKNDPAILPLASITFNSYMKWDGNIELPEQEAELLRRIEEELVVSGGQFHSYSVYVPGELGEKQLYPLVCVLTVEQGVLFNHWFVLTPYGTGHLAFPCREDGQCFECEETLMDIVLSVRGLYDMLDRTLSVFRTKGWTISFPRYWEDVYVLTREGEEEQVERTESENRIRPVGEFVQFVSGQVFIQLIPITFADLQSNPFIAGHLSKDLHLRYGKGALPEEVTYDLSGCLKDLSDSFWNEGAFGGSYIRRRQTADRLVLKGDYESQKEWLLVTSNRAYRVYCLLSLTDTDDRVFEQYVADIDRMLDTLTDVPYSGEEARTVLQTVKEQPVRQAELSETVYPELSPELSSPGYVLEKVSRTGKVTEEIYFCKKNQHFMIPYQDKVYERTSWPYTLQEEETTFRILDKEGKVIGERETIDGYNPEDMLIYQYGIWAPVLLDEEAWDVYAAEHPAPEGLCHYVGYEWEGFQFGQDPAKWRDEPSAINEGVGMATLLLNYYEVPVGNDCFRFHTGEGIYGMGVFYWSTDFPVSVIPYPTACTGKEGPAFMSWEPPFEEQRTGERCYWFFIIPGNN